MMGLRRPISSAGASAADALEAASRTADPVEACQILQEKFGDDFPVFLPFRFEMP
jgi:hypothetical protein